MEIVVIPLTVPGLGEATRPGGAGLGSLFDGGSYGPVTDLAAGPTAAAAFLGTAAAAVRAAGVDVEERAGSEPSPAGRSGVTLVTAGGAADGAQLRRLGERAALCLLLTEAADAAGRANPVALFYGRGLPALGGLAACRTEDLLHTWIALAGGRPAQGRHLLHEQPEVWDSQLERELTHRLRQLYGE
jgi:hypothetical protein